MLRAARFETRMGFHMEPRTEELLRNAAELLDRVTGPRILHEISLILEEKSPEDTLCRLQDLDILRHVSPGLHCDEWLAQRFRSLRDEAPSWGGELSGESLRDAYLALLTSRLPEEELADFVDRFRLRRSLAELLFAFRGLLQDEKRLARRDVKPSDVRRILDSAPIGAVRLLWYATAKNSVRRHVEDYVLRLRDVRPSLTGNDLKALGLPPGPLYKNLLAAVLIARLDGEVSTLDEERALAQQLVAEGRELPSLWPRR
jgi:tRNA nucleotidyltransferase (CCA-adding enzyme)